MVIWSVTECSVALISAAVPSLQFLCLRVINALSGNNLPRKLTYRTKSSRPTVNNSTEQSLAPEHGSFARLNDEVPSLGFTGARNNYEVSAFKKYGAKDGDIELEAQKPVTDERARIMVSRSVDVVSSVGSEGPRLDAGYT